MKSSTSDPWFNTEHMPERAAEETFAYLLASGALPGSVRLTANNLYLAIGFANHGIGNWDVVEADLVKWCGQNDLEHVAGWILMVDGDGYYGHDSIETVAQFVSARGTPVVFLQSDFGRCAPGDKYWPSYACAGLFGRGRYNTMVNGRTTEAWGGRVRDNTKGLVLEETGELAYPDHARHHISVNGRRLVECMGGIFVAGGGETTRDQTKIYRFGSGERAGDWYCPAKTLDGRHSDLNCVHGVEHSVWKKNAMKRARTLN